MELKRNNFLKIQKQPVFPETMWTTFIVTVYNMFCGLSRDISKSANKPPKLSAWLICNYFFFQICENQPFKGGQLPYYTTHRS